MSELANVIRIAAGKPSILPGDDWQVVSLPPAPPLAAKPAGKEVLFQRTGEAAPRADQVAAAHVPAGRVLVPLALWLARRDELADRLADDEIGVWLETHELVETLADSVADEALGLDVFPVIAIHIERFADGRACSSAALLRSRYRYGGELRAFGDVLRDQLFYLRRCGFCTFRIRRDRCAVDALAGLRDFSEPYQAAVVVDQPLWRRYARA